MANKEDLKPKIRLHDEFDLGSEDLFFAGSSVSPRKNEDTSKRGAESARPAASPLSFEVESSVLTMSPSRFPLTHLPLAQSSPRLIRKESEDGVVQEYRMNSPIVRRSKSLALRRVTSELCNSSPHFKRSSPIPAKRRRFCLEGKMLTRVKSEDRISEGSKESSSGRESESIETDEEAGNRFESLQSEEMELDKQKHEEPGSTSLNSSGLDDSVSAVVRVPFQRMFVQHEAELLRDLDKIQRMDKDEPQKEFKINRRWSGRRLKESLDTLNSPSTSGTSSGRLFADPKSAPDHQRIKSAVEILATSRNAVISDGTMPYALPCYQGKKEELMFITVDTLAEVMNGGFSDAIDHYEVIDCRYPYEYDGGHIMGALNMYKADSIEEIMSWKTENDENKNKRMVLIFHCEFSSQRGPSMMRLLRNTDRKHNLDCYPYLCHPEIYLLAGGYKAFYEKYPELCDPQNYIPMTHRDYQSELKMIRSKATTWHGNNRTNISRSLIL